jgi:hypothetical protein
MYGVAVHHQRERLPHSELVVVVALFAFATLMTRNGSVAIILLAPVVAYRLTVSFDGVQSGPKVPRAFLPLTLVLTIVSGVAAYAQEEPVPPNLPRGIAQWIESRPGVSHVLPAYNVSGFIRAFGGDGARVAIDGRTDRYGAERIEDQFDFQEGLPGWENYLREQNPDLVVLDRRMPVVQLMQKVAGWNRVMRDGRFVLLEPTK